MNKKVFFLYYYIIIIIIAIEWPIRSLAVEAGTNHSGFATKLNRQLYMTAISLFLIESTEAKLAMSYAISTLITQHI